MQKEKKNKKLKKNKKQSIEDLNGPKIAKQIDIVCHATNDVVVKRPDHRRKRLVDETFIWTFYQLSHVYYLYTRKKKKKMKTTNNNMLKSDLSAIFAVRNKL